MDLMFAEVLEVCMPHVTVMQCQVAPSREEVLRQILATAGIELIDYGSFTVQPVMSPKSLPRTEVYDLVSVYSNAYRERREREAMGLRWVGH